MPLDWHLGRLSAVTFFACPVAWTSRASLACTSWLCPGVRQGVGAGPAYLLLVTPLESQRRRCQLPSSQCHLKTERLGVGRSCSSTKMKSVCSWFLPRATSGEWLGRWHFYFSICIIQETARSQLEARSKNCHPSPPMKYRRGPQRDFPSGRDGISKSEVKLTFTVN